ncbi:MAG: hypothetical protein EHM23_30140 [Acidobacteria bacterium]|nr:MAG: hypothetical protein EHM23_30140 [Acidobacteriota bacterium]
MPEEKNLSPEDVLSWTSGLTDKEFAEFFYNAVKNRNTAEIGAGHFVLGDTWKLPEEPWSVDLIAMPRAGRHECAEDIICETGTCTECGSRVRSWAKNAICPVCGTDVRCS